MHSFMRASGKPVAPKLPEISLGGNYCLIEGLKRGEPRKRIREKKSPPSFYLGAKFLLWDNFDLLMSSKPSWLQLMACDHILAMPESKARFRAARNKTKVPELRPVGLIFVSRKVNAAWGLFCTNRTS